MERPSSPGGSGLKPQPVADIESPPPEAEQEPLLPQNPNLPSLKGVLTIICVSCITLISCFLGGVATIVVPQISRDLNLDPSMELWWVAASFPSIFRRHV